MLMKKITNTIKFVLIGAAVGLTACQQSNIGKHYIKTDGPEVVSFRALQFDFDDVKILEGPFLEAIKRNEKILLNYESDRFLAHFRERAGLKPKAEHYGGWEGKITVKFDPEENHRAGPIFGVRTLRK